MGQFFPDIAWRTILREVALDDTDYQYTVKVLPEDPNEPGADPMVVDEDCWIVDYAGYTYQIVNVSGNELTLYDVNKRKWGDNFIGPTPNMEAYVYKPKNGAFLLTQAQLRYLDKSATDKIYPVEKGVAWAHRGIRLGEDEIATELEIEGAEVTYEGEGWRGGGKYKITIVSELPEHNELDGLNDGDYQHLTSAEKTDFDALVSGLDIGSVLHNHDTLYEVPLTISNSLRRTANTLDLQGDSASPGNSKYYGTNSSGTKGFHNLPVLPSLKTIAENSITGSGNLINIYVSSSEPLPTEKLDGDIWVEK